MSQETAQSPESEGTEPSPGDAAPGPGAISAEPQPPSEPLGPVIAEAVERVAAALRVRGRSALESGARRARHRMDLYQARRDLDRLYQKLGREVVRLVEAGEVTHPGLVKGADRVQRQEEAVTAAAEARRAAPVEEETPEPEPELS